jgi:hypothetical protein
MHRTDASYGLALECFLSEDQLYMPYPIITVVVSYTHTQYHCLFR